MHCPWSRLSLNIFSFQKHFSLFYASLLLRASCNHCCQCSFAPSSGSLTVDPFLRHALILLLSFVSFVSFTFAVVHTAERHPECPEPREYEKREIVRLWHLGYGSGKCVSSYKQGLRLHSHCKIFCRRVKDICHVSNLLI